MTNAIVFAILSTIKIGIVIGVLLLVIAYLIWVERKVMAHMQVRMGPMRVGWHGLLQPIADGLKLITKEDIIPANASKILFIASPAIAMVPALLSIAVIPFGDTISIMGVSIDMVITDVNIGILFILAVSSVGVYGILLGGWSSNNKYSLLGGLRSSAQMISYELSMGLSLIGVIMMTGSLSLVDTVNAQTDLWFVVLQPVAFLVYAISAIAETNRCPFDLPEAETELVSGFHTEYSSMKFALFFMAEYANIITVSAVGVTFFFGGWRGPFLPPVVWFLIKMALCIFFFVWLRSTFPRFRIDQLMQFAWKVLLPVAVVNVLITGIVMTLL
ncbi:MAG: NADH-quinone oxidoreductase subunit NuoH [Candidatus Scalindua sp.]|jgi:NADH-quinone oxidoreductase subunit H|nr:NADH-quinone oxidoreductase subunit NuoH [Candidatus Scalindua sp.]MBT5306125.1 NADH-quinone oxidoreductase subunit NuoH [Candidatus Scalindua sp.]MBT6049965.1 NADH-quinone oxidoreductase subunit NuoH [Candidatus Scalindua sp.]MBT7211214.1 NADH-quinone oxidoreductase subunit NuoH [Candidatus Scalindua sp.]MBT7591569.1 NADH-quinone oxidoreductase subunit NuoH [Candidatus Scalindua sp.]